MNKFVLAAATAAVAFTAAPSQAAIVLVTYTGVVSSGIDVSGVFGVANADLTGKTFVAEYRFDNSKGALTNNATTSEARGGTVDGAVSPGLGASLTINGISKSTNGSYFSQLAAYTFPDANGVFTGQTSEQTQFSVTDRVTQNQLSNFASGYNADLPSSNEGPINKSLAGIDSRGGFTFYEYVFATGLETVNASGQFRGESLTVNVESPVPEPATWAMMLVGFGAVGGAVRGAKRRKLAVSFA